MPYQTLAGLKEYMGRDTESDTEDDGRLQSMLRVAQRRIEVICRTRFEVPDDTVRRFDYTALDYGGDLYMDQGPGGAQVWTPGHGAGPGWNLLWRTKLWFDQPLAQLTSITIDGEVIADTEYRLDPLNDTPWHSVYFTDLVLSLGDTATINIEGRWGYSVAPPEDIVHATSRLAQYYFEQRKAPVFDTIGSEEFGGDRTVPRSEPQDVKYMLIPYKWTPVIAR